MPKRASSADKDKKQLYAFRLEAEVIEALDRIKDELSSKQPKWRSKVTRTEALRAAVLERADKIARGESK